jgi:hypothetical protein
MPFAIRFSPDRKPVCMLLAAGLTLLLSRPAAGAEALWKRLLPGVEYATLSMPGPVTHGDGLLHVVRIDPATAELRLVMSSEPDPRVRTAKQWCLERGLAVAINAGMFQTDFRTHVGFLRSGGSVNSRRWLSKYNSVLAFGPKHPGLPKLVLLDREGLDEKSLEPYDTVLQNLRLIRGPGVNAWARSERRWSEAAIAADRQGRLLFLHCRSPFSMHQFNAAVLALPLGIVRAMHAEGGPEASLSIHAGGVELDLAGSYETGFTEHDRNAEQWQLPVVLGVAASAGR